MKRLARSFGLVAITAAVLLVGSGSAAARQPAVRTGDRIRACSSPASAGRKCHSRRRSASASGSYASPFPSEPISSHGPGLETETASVRIPPGSSYSGVDIISGPTNRLFALALLGVFAGCGSAATTGDTGPGRPAPGAAVTTAPTGDVAEQAAIVDSIRSTYTQADVDFMAGMIHHHAQALVMAHLAPSHGASPAMLTLTRRIINAQRDEILLMQRWLRDRGEEVPEVDEAGHMTMPHAHGGMEMMPGMLSDEQLAALDAARGEEFDRLFLQFMIQHHQGALTMVDELVATRGGAREQAVFKLASDIGADQASEITRMQTMLRDLLFADNETESP